MARRERSYRFEKPGRMFSKKETAEVEKKLERMGAKRKKIESYFDEKDPDYQEMVKLAKEEFGRKWKSRVRARKRETYRKRKKAKIKLDDVDEEAVEIVKASLLAMGTVIVRYNTCGKDDCPCMHGGFRHGPYYYLALSLPADMVDAGMPRTKHLYITPEEAADLEERTQNMKRLMNRAWDEIWDEFTKSKKEKIKI